MSAYYNDSDPFVCAWLRNLIEAKLLPAGDVDERPIEQVQASDVARYEQCHFFAGIGGWPYALQLAGWGDRPVWTGSCPCQPFSAAGTRKSHADARHLWPAWFNLIRECHPLTVFGEQVSGAAGLGWLDAVALDLETLDYAVGACVLGAHSVGAPHVRQRLYFVGDSRLPLGQGRGVLRSERPDTPSGARQFDDPRVASTVGELAELPECARQQLARTGSPPSIVANADGGQPGDGAVQRGGQHGLGAQNGRASDGLADATSEQARATGLARQPWDAVDWLPCRDGKARPVEPGTFPLAHGIPQRVGRLRAYGNAINPYTAAAFVSAYMEIAP